MATDGQLEVDRLPQWNGLSAVYVLRSLGSLCPPCTLIAPDQQFVLPLPDDRFLYEVAVSEDSSARPFVVLPA